MLCILVLFLSGYQCTPKKVTSRKTNPKLPTTVNTWSSDIALDLGCKTQSERVHLTSSAMSFFLMVWTALELQHFSWM